LNNRIVSTLRSEDHIYTGGTNDPGAMWRALARQYSPTVGTTSTIVTLVGQFMSHSFKGIDYAQLQHNIREQRTTLDNCFLSKLNYVDIMNVMECSTILKAMSEDERYKQLCFDIRRQPDMTLADMKVIINNHEDLMRSTDWAAGALAVDYDEYDDEGYKYAQLCGNPDAATVCEHFLRGHVCPDGQDCNQRHCFEDHEIDKINSFLDNISKVSDDTPNEQESEQQTELAATTETTEKY
jgi:hypothetical protein